MSVVKGPKDSQSSRWAGFETLTNTLGCGPRRHMIVSALLPVWMLRCFDSNRSNVTVARATTKHARCALSTDGLVGRRNAGVAVVLLPRDSRKARKKDACRNRNRLQAVVSIVMP